MFSDRTNWNLKENRLTVALARLRASGRRIFDLSASNPTAAGFSYDEPSILTSLSDHQAMQYSPDPQGLLSARLAVCAYYSEMGAPVAPHQIVLSTGTSEAYSFLFRLLCNPGDEVLIPTPSYPLFDVLAEIQDVRLVRYPLIYDHGWQIDFRALQENLSARTRAVIVVNPNNPTGHYAKQSEVSELVQFCSGNDLALIADEVFLDFSLSDGRWQTFAKEAGALTFTLSGISKICGLPQMKAAWTVVNGPRSLKLTALERLEVLADTYLSVNAPIQHALPKLLGQRHDFQRQLKERACANLTELDRQLAASKICSRLELEGGWCAVLRVPAIRADEDCAIDLLESKSVYVHPGHFYDFASERYMVVSLIIPIDGFAEGIARLLTIF